jgi:hypothetical protein
MSKLIYNSLDLHYLTNKFDLISKKKADFMREIKNILKSDQLVVEILTTMIKESVAYIESEK